MSLLPDLEPLCDLTKYSLDKVEKFGSYIINPKGTEKEAIENYIEKIKEQKLPPLIEAALISETKKTIRKFCNQNDIYNMAVKLLSDSNKSNDKRNYDTSDEWFSYFFEKCGHFSDEEMKTIWARMLAGELSTPGSIPKSLIHSLSVIEKEQAVAFSVLCSYAISFNSVPHLICDMKKDSKFWASKNISLETIFELQNIGLVTHNSNLDFKLVSLSNNLGMKSGKNLLSVKRKDNAPLSSFPSSNVVFTAAGRALYKCIDFPTTPECQEYIIRFLTQRGYVVDIVNSDI